MRLQDNRLSRIEKEIGQSGDRQLLEELTRQNYNRIEVSDEALHAAIEARISGQPEPEWVKAEFLRPIPPDADQHRVREAERLAKNALTNMIEM